MWRSELKESLRMALSAVGAHKLRSSLTLLGITIGVFSIIVVMTAMRVLQDNIESEISQLGANTFAVGKWPGVYFGGRDGFEKFWRRKNITYNHAQAVIERATLAKNIGVEADFWSGEATSQYGKTPPGVQLKGVTPGSFPARNYNLGDGRPILENDVQGERQVCILGATLSETLFPHGAPLNERVKFSGHSFTVIGVLEKKGTSFGNDGDSIALIPTTTGLNIFGRTWRSLNLAVQAHSPEAIEPTIEQVRGILRGIRKVPPGGEDDFEIFTNDSMIQQFQSFTLVVRVAVAVISSISLLAAGVGIMNIMLVSVTERTREIGIRRAVGAKKRNILSQFVMEAIVLCQLGGLIGIALGVAGGNVAAFIFKLPPVIPYDWVVIGLLLCSAVGVIFGTYPAVKAANLDPIDSLRYE